MQGAKFARHTTGFPREKAAQLGQGSREVDIRDAQKIIYLRCSKENIQDVQKRIFKAQDMFNSRYSNVPTKIRPNGLDRSASWSLEILNFGHWTRKKYYLKASFG